MRVAICDDEKIFVKASAEAIENLSGLEISKFSNSSELLESIESGNKYHIYILDIEMPNIDGLTLAKNIRKHSYKSVIIFITGYSNYVFDVFEVEAFRFIPKDKIGEQLLPAVKKAVEKLNREKEKVYIVKGSECESIPLNDIVYVEYMSKYISIYKNNGKVQKERKYLHSFMEDIDDTNFIYVTKSIAVNKKYIKTVKEDSVLLKDEKNLPLSRRQVKSVKKCMLDYWSSQPI